MKYDNIKDIEAVLDKALIPFDFKQLIETSGIFDLLLVNDSYTIQIGLDKITGCITFGCYNRGIDKHYNNKILYLTRATRSKVLDRIYNHIK